MLILDAALILVHPLPDTLQEGFAADLMAIYAFLIQQPLDDVLRGDTGVIFSRHPQGVVALHAMVANGDILNGSGDGVTKVKRARYAGRPASAAPLRPTAMSSRVTSACLAEVTTPLKGTSSAPT